MIYELFGNFKIIKRRAKEGATYALKFEKTGKQPGEGVEALVYGFESLEEARAAAIRIYKALYPAPVEDTENPRK